MSIGYRFAIIDDHIYWRQALIDLFREKMPNGQIVFESSSAKDLMNFIAGATSDQIPDIITLDLQMPGLDGFETARWLFLNQPSIKIIALSLFQSETTIIRLLNFGVKGFLHKNTDAVEILDGIESVIKGDFFFSAALNIQGENVITKLESIQEWKRVSEKWSTLTLRDKEIIKLLCTDLRYDEIAKKIGIAKSSLENIARSLYDTFGLAGRIPFVIMAHKYRLIRQ